MSNEEKKKSITVNFENKCGKLDLKMKGKNAISNALKVMSAFDDGCKGVKKK